MSTIPLEHPPAEFTAEQAAYLARMFSSASSAVELSHIVPDVSIVPAKPAIGAIYHFNTIVGPITTIGFWGYSSTGWVQLG